jgi:hypothetical protein
MSIPEASRGVDANADGDRGEVVAMVIRLKGCHCAAISDGGLVSGLRFSTAIPSQTAVCAPTTAGLQTPGRLARAECDAQRKGRQLPPFFGVLTRPLPA